VKKKNNIEKFLKDKLEHLDNSFQSDWDAFEQKLTKALFFHRLRQFAFWGSTSLVFFFMISNPDQLMLFPPDSTNKAVVEVSDNKLSQEKKAQEIKVANFVEEKAAAVASKPNTKKAPLASGTDVMPTGSSVAISNVKEEQAITPIKLNIPKSLVFNDEPDIEIIEDVHDKKTQLRLKKPNFAGLEIDDQDRKIIPPVKKVNYRKKGNQPYISPLQSTNPWSWSVNVYPNFSFRKLRIDRDKIDFLHRDFVDAMETAERTGFSYNVGLEISKRIGAITYLNTGVEYISYKTDAQFNFSNFREENIHPETGKIIGYTLKENPEQILLADENVYHYINIPLTISYQPWASTHVRLNIEAGGSLLYFAEANGKTLDYKTLEFTDLSQQEYRSYIGSFCFKMGANYYVSRVVNIGFEPTLVYFTNTIYTDDYPFNVIPYSVGLNFNLQIKLN